MKRNWFICITFAILIGWNMWLTAHLNAVEKLALTLQHATHVVIKTIELIIDKKPKP